MNVKNGHIIKLERFDNFINTIDPVITNNCNLLCKHCWGYNSRNENMDKYTYKKFLDFAKFMNIKDIQFTGGEPLLNSKFLDFAKINKIEGFNTKLRTNFSTKKFSKDFIIDILENFSHVYVSIDGDYLTNFLIRPTKKYVILNKDKKLDKEAIKKMANENFETIKHNIDNIINVKNEIKSETKIIIATVVQKKNLKKISKILDITNLYNDIRWDITQVILEKNDKNNITKEEFLKEVLKIVEKSINIIKIKPISLARCLKVETNGDVRISYNKDIIVGSCLEDKYDDIKLKLEHDIKKNNKSYHNYYFIPNKIIKEKCIW